MRNLLLPIFISFCTISLTASTNSLEFDPSQLHLRIAYAMRTATAPTIDGRLVDPEWGSAIPISSFLQLEPDNLAPATEATEARILFDDENIYVAIRAYDSEPDKIVARLARRDAWMEAAENSADWVGVMFDSRNDDRTAFVFAVNAAGVMIDSYVYNDDNFDLSWDGVWDVEVKIDDEGWSAEFEIPFSLFRFNAGEDHDWGFLVDRGIQRKQEYQRWPGKKRGVEGLVSRFGILKGIEDIPAPKQIEILPYVLGGRQAENDDPLAWNMGLDVEYGLGSNATLNITFNPDFGQVEADPSILNLTAFETFYEEKRPFFIEGGSFFKQRIQQFHSRRIGREPNHYFPDTGSIINKPDMTTILTAAKVTGKTSSGLGFGIIESITDEEYGIWQYLDSDSNTVTENFLLEPYTNYLVGRIDRPVFNSVSTVGMMITDVRRQGSHSSSTGGVNWDLSFLDNKLDLTGQLLLSRTNSIKGHAGRFFIGYDDPVWWGIGSAVSWYEDTFDPNDLGFLDRSGVWNLMTFINIRKQDPWGLFLRNDLHSFYFYKARTDGLSLPGTLGWEQSNLTKYYWAFGIGGEYNFSSFDDADIFKGSPWVIGSPKANSLWGWFRSDSRKPTILQGSYGFGADILGGSGYRTSLDVILKPTDYLDISINAVHSILKTRKEYITTNYVSGDTNIIYSNSTQFMDDIQLHINWTFTNDITIQLFLQPFNADVNYYNFKRLMAPKSLIFEEYPYGSDPDFKLQDIIGTFVFRWEYSPGSTLFVVYNLSERGYYSADLSEWSKTKENALFIKLNYWLQM
ncbi:MAG: DUF5916 domain-containing protein [Fidelibacterota bacterium]